MKIFRNRRGYPMTFDGNDRFSVFPLFRFLKSMK